MQTTGAALLAANRCSIVRVQVPAQDGRKAHGLLYLAAVLDAGREQGHRQGMVDTDRRSAPANRTEDRPGRWLDLLRTCGI